MGLVAVVSVAGNGRVWSGMAGLVRNEEKHCPLLVAARNQTFSGRLALSGR